MILALFADSTAGEIVVRSLAVVGGAALGAILAGWVIGWVQRTFFEKDKEGLPASAHWIIRGAAAILFGLLTYLIVFGTGGWGLGGPGGPGSGAGPKDGVKEGKKDGSKEGSTSPSKDGKKDKEGPPPPSTQLNVEVLGDEPLKKIHKVSGLTKDQQSRRYRVQVEGSNKLMGMQELQQYIDEHKPPLKRVEVIVYKDSPVSDQPAVKDLTDWLAGLGTKLVAAKQEPKKFAPVE